ncbi:T9SS type A sorting domain-containing protein [Ginsengibacter hankyongi]|uniref:T9SS type A sorting domain-containing protein n=1 Tax=Ginsengibacter hankyongi TaxID=2607284 RepID=A0A5J5IMK1_9BACT|nr:T9SS type A sorting domain-containing protein [Ginsengibacter hankyongi]
MIALYNRNAPFKVNAVNPFKEDLKINIFLPNEGNVFISLYDIFGRMITKKNMQFSKGTSQITLNDLGSLSPGMYVLRTEFNNKIVQNKLFKVN